MAVCLVPCECQLTGHFAISIKCRVWLEILPICIRFYFIIYDIFVSKTILKTNCKKWIEISERKCKKTNRNETIDPEMRSFAFSSQSSWFGLNIQKKMKKNGPSCFRIIIEIKHDFDVFLKKIIGRKKCMSWVASQDDVYVCVCASISPLNRQNYPHDIHTKMLFEDLFLLLKNDSFRAELFPNKEKNKLGQWRTTASHSN